VEPELLDQTQPEQSVVVVVPGLFHLLLGHLQLMPAAGAAEIITGELEGGAVQVGAAEVPPVLPVLLEHQTLGVEAVQEVRLHLVTIITAAPVAQGSSSYVYLACIQQLSQVD
jgi:hypothetical protein